MNILLLAVLLTIPPGRCATSTLDEGRRLMLENRYPEAVVKLERAAQKNPGSPDVLLNLGWAYWHVRRIDDAVRVGSTLVKLDPENRVFLLFLANTSIEKRDYAAAKRLVGRVLTRFPGDREASMILARAQFLAGRKEEALAIIDKVLLRFPNDPAAVYQQAEFMSELGRKPEALASLDRLLKANPDNASYRKSRARILAEMGRQAEATSEWEKLTRRTSDAQALMNLGWTYWRQRNITEAWKIASLLVKLDDKNAAFLRFMANLEIERMNYSDALRLSRAALSLAPDDRDTQLTLAKAYFRMQREKEAMTILEKLIARYPDNPAVEFRWAEFLLRTGRAKESLSYFDRLVNVDPANDTYHIDGGLALYDLGLYDAALSEWRSLALRQNPNMDATRLMRDDAFNKADWKNAAFWQKKIIAADPANPAGWEKLSRIYSSMNEPARALLAAEAAIRADPASINAFYIKGEIFEQTGNWPAAEAAYTEVIERNPNSIRAFDGLSFALEAQNRYDDAIKALRRIEQLSRPTVSPYLQIHKARLLANSGHFAKAHAILRRLAADDRTPIPVLLYHGIYRSDRYDSLSADRFRAQMLALKEKGYQTMTVSELDRVFRGKARLPQKPILITFDDARTDSFENADPVLKELGFRATMFVHVSKLRKPHFHASPDDIARWQATGRWELQAHGYQAHDPMTLDAFGRRGHFLPNRMWLPDVGRMENLQEYRARVEKEYELARRGVDDIVPGYHVIAFAYPYGDYGQNDYSNTPEASNINQSLVKKNFRMAFVQEQYGINTLASAPTDLRRYEVPKTMTPEQLVAHLELSDARVQAELLDAELWVRADQLGNAQAIYQDLEARGIHQPEIWADEGVVFEKSGDIDYARNLFTRALAQEPYLESAPGERDRQLVLQAAHAAQPVVSAEAQAFGDSNTNEITRALLRASGVVKSVRIEGWGGESLYSDRRDPANPPHIHGAEGGVQARWFVNPRVELDGSYLRRVFTEGAAGRADNYTLGAYDRLLPSFRVAVRDGQGNVETAAAIRQAIKFHTDGAGISWDPFLNWNASADYDRSRYNDSNLEQDLRLRVAKRFSELIAVGAAYFHGDSTIPEPAYYTPRGLNQYTGVITFTQAIGEINPRTGLAGAEAMAQYEGGYGFQSSGSRSVNSIKAALTWRPLDPLSLSVNGEYDQSPTYISRLAGGTIAVSF